MPHSFGEVLLRIFTRDVRWDCNLHGWQWIDHDYHSYTWHIQQGYRALLAKFGKHHDESPPTPPATEAPLTPRVTSFNSDISTTAAERPRSRSTIRATPSYPNNAFMNADKPSTRTPKTPIGRDLQSAKPLVEPVSPSANALKSARKRVIQEVEGSNNSKKLKSWSAACVPMIT